MRGKHPKSSSEATTSVSGAQDISSVEDNSVPIPPSEQDTLENTVTQDEYLREAAAFLNSALKAAGGIGGSTETLGYLTRGVLQLANRSPDEALHSFDNVLSKSPDNVLALLGKVSCSVPWK